MSLQSRERRVGVPKAGRRAAGCGLMVAMVVACLAFPATALARTRVVFTIDVESKGANQLPQQVDTICTGGAPCGLMEIARMLKARGIAGTFFLNVYESPKWGEAVMRDMTIRLQAAGQDVGLHTHPETMFDLSRTEMYDYTLDEQTAIVREGVRLLRSWSGLPVVSHRAGDYSANAATLEALRRNGVLVDSSLFFGHRHSGLDVLGLPRNRPSLVGGLTEIPVTVFERADRPRPFGDLLPPVTSLRKVDIDWLIDAGEMRGAIDAAVAADLPVLVVFMHSFSLMEPPAGGAVAAHRPSIDMLEAILEYVSSKGLEVASMREIAADQALGSVAGTDVVPSIPVRVDWARYLWHAGKTVAGAAAIAGALLAFLSLVAVLVLVRRRRARQLPWPDAAKLPPVTDAGAGRV